MKKALILLLCLLFITNSAFANVTYYVEEKFAGTMAEKPESGIVTYIVELEGGGLLERKHQFGAVNFADFEAQAIDDINDIQAEAVFQAEAITGEDVTLKYTHIMNGFSIDGDISLMEKLEKIDGVKDVSIADTFYFDASSTSTLTDAPDHSVQDEMIGLSEEIRANYTGKGIVIGVIDSEFRHEHEAFQTAPEEQSLTKDEITEILKNNELAAEINLRNSLAEAEITEEDLAERFYNNGKNPFMFDYVGCDTDATITQSYLHGTHVAAIAAGNSDKFKGVAPDAQLVFMKVSSDGGSGASEANICAALDDLVKLNVDVINMSMGTKAGFMRSERYNNIFSAIEEEGIAVAMSAGNAFRFGENRLTFSPMAEHPDYGMVSTPAAYEFPTAVASKNALAKSNETEEKMSDFSSWGATTDLRLKPEITALGGNIISAGRNNQYVYMNGTSMATPQYAGAVSVMLQYFDENMNYSKNLKQENAQKLLASTASIEYDDSIPVSPRKQGAGVINLTSAINTPTLMYKDSKVKIELGEIGDSVEFSFDIQNLAPQKATYTFDSIIMTDAYAPDSDGVNLVNGSRILENSSVTFKYDSVNITSLDVSAYAKKTVTATLTLGQDEIEELSAVFKNGFYVEGYIIATESSTNKETSIPFMGLHTGANGGWREAPLFHGNIMNVQPGYLGFTGIYSNRSNGMNFLNYGENDTLFYSTNGDNELIMFSDNIRNLRKLNVKITDANSNVVFNKNANSITKNHTVYAVNSQNQLVYDFNPYNGMVLSNSESKIPDGNYTVSYTGVSEYDGETTQSGSFNLCIDSAYPVITDAEYKITETGAYLYVKGVDDVVNPQIFVVDATGEIKEGNRAENGYYIFDMKGHDMTACRVGAADAAGNTALYTVSSARGYAAAYKESALNRINTFDALVLGRKIINKIDFAPENGETVRFFAWNSNLKPLTD